MRIYPTKPVSEEKPAFSYQAMTYIIALVQTVAIGAGALYYEPHILGYITGLTPITYIPLLTVVYGGAVLFSLSLQDLLGDFIRQMGYREKFTFFLFHCLFFFLPTFIMMRFFIVFALLSLNLFILLYLALPTAFTRLYCVNLFLMCTAVIKSPTASPVWMFTCIFLIGLSMMLDHFHFKTKSYDEKRVMKSRELLKIVTRYVLAPMVFGILVFMILPSFPHQYKVSPVIQPEAPRRPVSLTPSQTMDFIFDAVIMALFIMLSLAFLVWLQKKMRRGKKTDELPATGIMQKVQKFVREKILPHEETIPLNPRDKIIYEYNRFCKLMDKKGYGRKIFETPREYEGHLLKPAPYMEKAIHQIASLFEKVQFGNSPVTESDAAGYRETVEYAVTGFEDLD